MNAATTESQVSNKMAAGAMVALRGLVDAKSAVRLERLSVGDATQLKTDEGALRALIGAWAGSHGVSELVEREAEAAIRRWSPA
ncbi:hypothetical protein [Hydrogenophaga pseudoflava]|uniref:Uncharacterized protein n=1 Tax=Hydrogenophaga pseudoflava TaxID=47421 RepID=A0A4P6X6P8_HYDPS|nr:hypothetical protein [Hydrogenophaga pseudoflava]QBM30655.1 hypothetical protein HPF_23405 [Hydrogenophaga pseudoflava]